MRKIITSEEVFDNYFEALGGKKKMQEVESIKMEAHSYATGSPINMQSTFKYKKPNLSLVLINSEHHGSVMKQVFDGEKGYIYQANNKVFYNESQIALAKKTCTVFPELYIFKDSLSVDYNGVDETPEGIKVYKIKVCDIGKNIHEFYFNKENYLLVKKISSITNGTEKVLVESTSFYNDFKEVDGILMPFKLMVKSSQQNMSFNFTNIVFNEEMVQKDFQ